MPTISCGSVQCGHVCACAPRPSARRNVAEVLDVTCVRRRGVGRGVRARRGPARRQRGGCVCARAKCDAAEVRSGEATTCQQRLRSEWQAKADAAARWSARGRPERRGLRPVPAVARVVSRPRCDVGGGDAVRLTWVHGEGQTKVRPRRCACRRSKMWPSGHGGRVCATRRGHGMARRRRGGTRRFRLEPWRRISKGGKTGCGDG